MRRLMAAALSSASVIMFLAAFSVPSSSPTGLGESTIKLTPCHVEGVKEELRCGKYEVFENRRTRTGRKLPLKIVVIPAGQPHPDQRPIFYMAGGPGETATELAD